MWMVPLEVLSEAFAVEEVSYQLARLHGYYVSEPSRCVAAHSAVLDCDEESPIRSRKGRT